MKKFIFSLVMMIFLGGCASGIFDNKNTVDQKGQVCEKCISKTECTSCKINSECKSCSTSSKCKNGICPMKTSCTSCKDGKGSCSNCATSSKCKSTICPLKAKSTKSSCCNKT